MFIWPFSGHGTATAGKDEYRPSYLDHFEKNEKDKPAAKPTTQPQQNPPAVSPKTATPPHHFQRSFIDGDFEFVSIKTTCNNFFFFNLIPWIK